jgi:hypothetical protein
MLKGVVRRGLLFALGVGVKPGGCRPEVHASSSVRASLPTALCDRDAPVSSASWISRVVALVIVSGMANTYATVAGSSSTRVSMPSASAATGRASNVPFPPTTASAAPGSVIGAGAPAASTNWGGDASRPSLTYGGTDASSASSM